MTLIMQASGVPEHIIEEATSRLQLAVAQITDNDIPHMPQAMQVGIICY